MEPEIIALTAAGVGVAAAVAAGCRAAKGKCPACGSRLGGRKTGASGFIYRECPNQSCTVTAVMA